VTSGTTGLRAVRSYWGSALGGGAGVRGGGGRLVDRGASLACSDAAVAIGTDGPTAASWGMLREGALLAAMSPGLEAVPFPLRGGVPPAVAMEPATEDD
jgi:hypothetical protein